MSGRRLFIVLLLATTARSASAYVPVDPNNARGFGDKVYHVGDVDSVNVFNGNLVVRLPLGSAYPTGPTLGYQLVLTANSRVWDYEYVEYSDYPGDPVDKRRAIPETISNAGLGWSLSLGRLTLPKEDTKTTSGHGYIYRAPDGSEHEFFSTLRAADPPGSSSVGYTHDGSYLRLTLNVETTPTALHRVEFPDGTLQYFHAADGRLKWINDRFDNWVQVAYTSIDCDGNAGTSEKCDVWTIMDGYADTASTRSHTVTFKNKASKYNPANFQQVVSTVSLDAFGDGDPAVYTFHYLDDGGDATSVGRGGCGDWISTDPTSVLVPLLSSVDLPDGSKFQMEYLEMDSGACASGALDRLTLPTGGAIQWNYADYTLPLQECNQQDFWTNWYGGVVKRSFFQPGATNAEAVWTYAPLITPRNPGQLIPTNCWGVSGLMMPYPPQEFTNTVVNPAGDKTVHYFSVYPPGATSGNAGPFKGPEYGLPFTRFDELETGGRALTSAVYDCVSAGCASGSTLVRKTYVQYAGDGTAGVSPKSRNSRVERERVTHETDTGCSSATCRVDRDFSDFDGYGHYRKTSITSNFPSSVSRETFTGFNPGSSSTGKDSSGNEYFSETEPWILGTYDSSWTKEGTNQATRSLFTFDSSTGVLLSSRKLKAGLPSGSTDPGAIPSGDNDLLTVYCRNTSASGGTGTAASRGFVTSQRHVGGDHAAIPTGDLCSIARSEGRYFMNYGYTFSGMNLTKRTSEWDSSGFLSSDEDLDTSTGLVKASRDSAGLQTSFSYDSMGRLEEVKPPSQAWTLFDYDVTATTPRVGIQLWAYGQSATTDPAGDAVKDDYLYYDGFGRVILSKTRMPSISNATEWAATKTEYDASGRIANVSTPMKRTTPDFETLTTTSKTTFSYDALGRTTEVKVPDNSATRTGYTGDRLREVSVVEAPTQQNPSPTPRVRSSEVYDGRGRLVKVTEKSNGTSSTNLTGGDTISAYEYDVADRLAKVTSTGTSSQQRTFTYDNRGWLETEQHPEKGLSGNGSVTYGSETDAAKGHDAVGLVWFVSEGSGANAISVSNTYDAAQRLTSVVDGAGRTVKTFEYATASSGSDYRKGKLYRAIRYNYLNAGTIIVTETYKYAGLGGRLSSVETKVVHKSASGVETTINQFTHSVEHESNFGRDKTITYPTCNATGCSTALGLASVGQLFDKGALETVTSYATIAYDPTGMVNQVRRTTPTTSIDTYAADSGMARPANIAFAGLTSCTPPAQPQIQSPSTVCPSSSSNQASVVSPVAGVTYTWTLTGNGTITSSTTGTSITFSAQASGSLSLTVTGANACGSAASSPRNVSIDGPTASVRAGTSIDRGQTATLSVDLTGTGPWSLTWADGYVQNGIGTSPATRTVTPLVTTTYTVTSVSDATCPGSVTQSAATVTVYPLPPASVVATSDNRVVSVSWPSSSGAVSYAIERGTSRTGGFAVVGTTTLLALTDTVPASATPITYVYRVRAIDSAGTWSKTTNAPLDFATTATTLFAESVTVGQRIEASHLAELQKAMDALRVASGLSPSFSGAPSLVGAHIAATDFTAMTTALNGALGVWGLPSFGYSGVTGPSPGVRVYAAHVTQLREAVR
jgi:YD repeat-containing protein